MSEQDQEQGPRELPNAALDYMMVSRLKITCEIAKRALMSMDQAQQERGEHVSPEDASLTIVVREASQWVDDVSEAMRAAMMADPEARKDIEEAVAAGKKAVAEGVKAADAS